MSKIHYACRDLDGEWRTACGRETQRVSGMLSDVDCLACVASQVFRAADAPAHAPSQPEGDGDA